MRIVLGLQYEGSQFSGWQTQALPIRSVQAELEKAIESFIGSEGVANNPVRTITAGRTDTGVHALGQVVHFDTSTERTDWSWVRGINAFLPPDIVINWAKPVSEEFSARFSAFERTYIYAVHASSCRAPLLSNRAGFFMLPPDTWFDIPAMKKAAECLIGEHDFSSFRSAECQSKTPIKTMYSIDIVSEQPWLYFRIRGNAFLHHMVRNLIGCFLMIGVGKQGPEWMQEVLVAKNRSLAAPTFAPDGLYLAKIAYPEKFEIPDPWLQNSFLPSQLLQN
ncbi:tRNA pseudouridine(38-40) synthase TruA [Polynucleobacter paneuropaeus]|uniref:tRNA pseudouridine synthase A n=1 Tax=Polynucleobacter paneuropaeus TaxID=2527775 RepID=A0ABX9F9S2_9BURK|nr:tRNA pseudouridine(38-40) synthase TruA [Polynucleobacter paneuropaeus]QWD18773.1 tRNA pseudouridine(38-40) synthase TruA [Polynucleobacter paneuropaeus]RAZ42184.1 tRNA pseudouridine(38-40) synthase TruA [Polynucleobacter paneuropaeus]